MYKFLYLKENKNGCIKYVRLNEGKTKLIHFYNKCDNCHLD